MKLSRSFLEYILSTLVLIVISNILTGCSDSLTSSSPLTSNNKQVKTEKEFVTNPDLKAYPGGVIIVNLEKNNSPFSSEDTGPIGEDIISYSYPETANCQFRLDSSGVFHVKLIKDSTNELIFEVAPGQSINVNIPKGNYKLHLFSNLYYSSSDSLNDVIFIQPETANSYSGNDVYANSIEDIYTLISTRRCINCNFNLGDLSNLDLRNVNASSSIFQLTNLSNVNFSNSILNNSQFDYSDFTNANFSDCSLNYIHMRNCDLSKASFKNSKIRNSMILFSKFNETILSGAEFVRTQLQSSTLNNVEAINTNLDSLNFISNVVNKTNFSTSHGIRTQCFGNKFKECDFSNFTMMFSSIVDCDFSRSTFINANFCFTNKLRMTTSSIVTNFGTQCFP